MLLLLEFNENMWTDPPEVVTITSNIPSESRSSIETDLVLSSSDRFWK